MKNDKRNARQIAPVVPEVVDGRTYADLVGAIGLLLDRAREKIATTANTTLVETYWNTGRYIVEYEQHGADRAKYGSALLSHLTRDLALKYGKGYGKSNLIYMRKLYRAFPKGMTVSYQLSWSHYLEILKCSDELEIGFYCAECARSNWNVRELAIALEEESRAGNRTAKRSVRTTAGISSITNTKLPAMPAARSRSSFRARK